MIESGKGFTQEGPCLVQIAGGGQSGGAREPLWQVIGSVRVRRKRTCDPGMRYRGTERASNFLGPGRKDNLAGTKSPGRGKRPWWTSEENVGCLRAGKGIRGVFGSLGPREGEW